jgi:nucleoside-diphosphate-sugar epimerase
MSRAATALVTGSAGFIGRNFARHLRAEGWQVEGIDVRPGPHTVMLDARDFFRGFEGRPGHSGYDLVIHAAAVVGGRRNIENDPLSLAVNLELDAALFRWARVTRPGRVVCFSSSAAYPVNLQSGPDARPLREDDVRLPGDGKEGPGIPDGMYGWSKLTGEYLARLAREAGVAVSVVRPFSGYGSDQDETYPFGAFIGRALRREDPFEVWGDGEQVRDFVHVDDIIGTVMEVVRLEHNGPVNIGLGGPVSMNQLAVRVCEIADYAPGIEHVMTAPSGVRWRVANATRLWNIRLPRVSLDEGIARALRARPYTGVPA